MPASFSIQTGILKGTCTGKVNRVGLTCKEVRGALQAYRTLRHMRIWETASLSSYKLTSFGHPLPFLYGTHNSGRLFEATVHVIV